ncbi:chromate resistance protein ChrB domain-containing protein [Actinomycetes bacterium KLBMP 9759]
MRWATRRGVHIDRAASAWLIRRFVDLAADFVFVADRTEVPPDATPFDMRGVELGHQRREGGQDCTFETLLRRFELTDPVLWKLAEAVHEADLEDDRFDAPEAAGLDAVLRGLSMTLDDDDAVLAVSHAMFDGLYEYYRRTVLLGRPSA